MVIFLIMTQCPFWSNMLPSSSGLSLDLENPDTLKMETPRFLLNVVTCLQD
jgi:hypothetical protein